MPLLVSATPAVGQATEEADSIARVENRDGDGPRGRPSPEFRFTTTVIGSGIGLMTGVALGTAQCGGVCSFGADGGDGLLEAVLLGGVGAVIGTTVGGCWGHDSDRCFVGTVPKAAVSLVGGLAGGAALALAADGIDGVSTRPFFVVGFAAGQALFMRWLW